MDNANEVLERLKAIGFNQEKADETLKLLYAELQEDLVADFVNQATEEEVIEYETRITEAKSLDHLTTIVQELGLKVYGDNAETFLKEKLEEKVKQIEEMTKNMKANLEKYQSGDPATVKAVNDAAQSQEAQDLVKDLL